MNSHIPDGEQTYIGDVCKYAINTFKINKQCFDYSTLKNETSIFNIKISECCNEISFRNHVQKLINFSPGKIENIIFHFGENYISPKGIEITIKVYSNLNAISDRIYTKFLYKKYRNISLKRKDVIDVLNNVTGQNELLIKNDFNVISEILLIVHNMSKYISEFEFIIQTWNQREGYILEIENVKEIQFSFIEYLFQKYPNSIYDVKIQQKQTENKRINSLKIYVKSFFNDCEPMENFQREIEDEKNSNKRKKIEYNNNNKKQRNV